MYRSLKNDGSNNPVALSIFRWFVLPEYCIVCLILALFYGGILIECTREKSRFAHISIIIVVPKYELTKPIVECMQAFFFYSISSTYVCVRINFGERMYVWLTHSYSSSFVVNVHPTIRINFLLNVLRGSF